MATKKTSTKKGGKRKRKGALAEDPPVVVGGGSSVDITFLDTATQPGNPVGRRRFRLPSNITVVVIEDGKGSTQLVRVVPALFKVSLF